MLTEPEQPHIVCEKCHLFMTPACDDQNCSAFELLYSIKRKLKELNDSGCWVGQTDSRKDAFDYVLELIVEGSK